MVVRLAILESVLASLFVVSAGRLDWPWFWGLLTIHASMMLVGLVLIDPDLLRERLRPGPGAQDRNIRLWLLPFLVLHLVVAGLDVGRFGWSGRLPTGVHVVALAAYASGLALSLWSMYGNRFFSSVIRLQTDRGHRLVSEGPYRFVRHPGYAGMLTATLSGGPAIGSWWSLLPLVPLVVILVWRIGLEERFLRGNLEGYPSYAGRVRYRLCPGVW